MAAPVCTITFSLRETDGPIAQVAPGVRRQTRANGLAYEFSSDSPLDFNQDKAVFAGRRGGIVMLPTVTSRGISHAPGTRGRIAVVPLLDNHDEFVLENLQQPPVFRRWQLER